MGNGRAEARQGFVSLRFHNHCGYTPLLAPSHKPKLLPLSLWTLGLVFTSGGIYVAIEETLEDSFCAERHDRVVIPSLRASR